MITCNSLSNNEVNFLCKSILRLQKENGCFRQLKSVHKSFNELIRYISNSDRELCGYLIGPVWQIVYKTHCYEGEKLSRWIASTEMIKFIKMINESKYKVFDRVSYELANQEFSYIKSLIDEIISDDGSLEKIIPEERIEELKSNYENVKHLTTHNKISF